MKKIISIFLILTIDTLQSEQIVDQFLNAYQKANTTHHFSVLSNNSKDLFGTYGIYGNSTHINLNNKTQLYSNFTLMKSMTNSLMSNELNYTFDLGIRYNLNSNTLLLLEFSSRKYPTSILNYKNYLP